MLQWMGGSRRKVTTSRKSTQNRQKQYFEQRKRQQQISDLDNCPHAIDSGREHCKEHRSLDILSLLNLSAIPQENKTTCNKTVQSHFVKNPAAALHNVEILEKPAEIVDYNDETSVPTGYKGETVSPIKNTHNDPDGHNSTNNVADTRSDQGKTYLGQNLTIFDLLGDDGVVGNSIGSSLKEAHVAFSVEGLGRVGLETPPCSPEDRGRTFPCGFSSRLKTTRSRNRTKNINTMDNLESEVDVMMQDFNMPRDDISLNYSIGMKGTCENQNNFLPTKTNFPSVEDYKDKHYGGKSMFDSMDEERDRWGDEFSFLDNDFLGEMEFEFLEQKSSNQIYGGCNDFLKFGKYDIFDNTVDIPYLPKKRSSTRTTDEFSIFEPAKSSLKHYSSGYGYDLMAESERKSRVTRNSDFEDKSLQPDWFCSVADDRTDSFSLLSEESSSSSAVKVDAFNSTSLNSNRRESVRRGRDSDFGPRNSNIAKSIYSSELHGKIRDDIDQVDQVYGGGKCAQKLYSKSKKVNNTNPPFMEKLRPFKSWSFENECNLSSLYQNPTTDHQFRSSTPWTVDPDPFFGSPFPESSFTNKHSDTVSHSPSSSIFKRFSVRPSNMESGVSERNFSPNSKLVGTSLDRAEVTGSYGGDRISPVSSAQESVGIEIKSEPKFPPSADIHKEVCIGSKGVCPDDKEWLDDSNCDSLRSETQVLSVNSEASHYSEQAEQTQPVSIQITDNTSSADENKYNYDDKVSIPCPKGEKEIKDGELDGEKMGSRNCGIDSSSQVMMIESYVLQLLFVQKVLKQASAHDSMKNS